MEFTCEAVRQLVRRLMDEPLLRGKIYVAGGIVPWLLSGRDSGRTHGDVDLVVNVEQMDAVRDFLKRGGYYREEMDSRFLPCNRARLDHGMEALIDGIPVNFAPFEREGDGLVQRNFALKAIAGSDALLSAVIRGISVDDYVTTCSLPDGGQIGAYTLEVVRAAKERSDREKDRADLREVGRIGVDRARYERVKAPIQNMEIRVTTDEPAE